MLTLAIGILFSIGAVDALIPLMIIVVLIVAAAGATRGYSIFNVFGIAALAGIGAGRGSIQGKSALGRFFLMSQRPGALGLHPKGKVKRAIRARRDLRAKRRRDIAIGEVARKGGDAPAPRTKGKVSRGALLGMKMAVMGKEGSKRRKGVNLVFGKPGSGRRQALRKVAWVSPVFGGLAPTLYRRYKKRKEANKSLNPLKRDPAKATTALDESLASLRGRQGAIGRYRDLRAAALRNRLATAYATYNAGGMSLKEYGRVRRSVNQWEKHAGLDQTDPAKGGTAYTAFVPAAQMRDIMARRFENIKDSYATGSISKERYDKEMEAAEKWEKLHNPGSPGFVNDYKLNRSSNKGIGLVTGEGRSPYGEVGVAAAITATKLGKAEATQGALDGHVKRILDARESGDKRAERAAIHDYNRELRKWQRDTGVRGNIPGMNQINMVRATVETGRGVGRAAVTGYGRAIKGVKNKEIGLKEAFLQPSESGTPGSARDTNNFVNEHMSLALHRSVSKAAGFDTLSNRAKRKKAKAAASG